MPTYQYACTACGHQLEAVQSFADDPLTQCPTCEGRLRKLFSSVGIVFKGSGFYRTDSRAGAVPSGESGSGANGGSGSTEKADSGATEKSGSGAKSDSAATSGAGAKSGSGDSGRKSGGASKATTSAASS